jgi:hypothetical protein
MKRRTFMKAAGMTGLVLGLPRFATAAQASKYAKTAPPIFDDYALNPARSWLQNYTPPTGYAPGKSQTLTFESLSCRPMKDAGKKPSSNVINAGGLVLKRTVEKIRIRYDLEQTLEDSTIEGSFVCRPDAFRTPLEWELTAQPHYEREHRKLATLNYRGTVSKDGCHCQAGPLDQAVPLNHPASLFWNLLDAGEALQNLKQKQHFDLFWEGLTARPSQTLENDGYTVLPGSKTPVKTVMLHGPAMMPQHFLVTEEGVPLGVTGFLVSWMLTKVEELV